MVDVDETDMHGISGSRPPGASAAARAPQPPSGGPAPDRDLTPTLHVVLDRPKIAGNVGAIARLCAATACRLHVCGPLGFHDAGAPLRRPGVDTWGLLGLHFHLSADRCLNLLVPPARRERPLLVVEVGDGGPPDQVSMPKGAVVVLGPEDGSVADSIVARADGIITLPTAPGVRSLNVAQCAAVIAFEALRQQR